MNRDPQSQVRRVKLAILSCATFFALSMWFTPPSDACSVIGLATHLQTAAEGSWPYSSSITSGVPALKRLLLSAET